MPAEADSKRIVARGYDEMAADYLRWSSGSPVRLHWLDVILAAVPPQSSLLDLGCGAGIPVAQHMARAGHKVIGIDGSARQIALARRNVPQGTFMTADMTTVEFAPGSFDAVTAFYSITHVPREEHLRLMKKIRGWLKPEGLFLASLGSGDSPGWTGEWLGTTMYFSHFDAATNRTLLAEAGFHVEKAEIMGEDEDGRMIDFLWVLVRRTD